MLSAVGILCLLAVAQARSVENGKSYKRQLSSYPFDGDLQLVGGTRDAASYSGILEISYRGAWYSVCDDAFDYYDALVACKQLGFEIAQVEDNSWLSYGLPYGFAKQQVLLDELACSGSESRLMDCYHIGVGTHDCDGRTEAAIVSCSRPGGPIAPLPPSGPIITGQGRVASLDIQSVRLTSGPHAGEGLLEVMIDGVYRYVCTNNFDDMDAKVACRMMNFYQGEAVAPYPYNANLNFWQISQMWMDDFQCRGTENALDQCPNMGYDRSSSNCVDKSMLAAIRCNTGSIAPAASTEVILSGGRTQYEGQVKCLHGDQYYPVCADNFSQAEAQVVCNQLFGYRGMVGTPVYPRSGEANAYYMQGFYEVQCQGTEESLTQCFSNFINNRQRTCSRGDATVTCSHPPVFG